MCQSAWSFTQHIDGMWKKTGLKCYFTAQNTIKKMRQIETNKDVLEVKLW